MDNVAGWILEVDRGSLLPYKGNYSAWLLQKQNRLGMEHSKQVRANVLTDSEHAVLANPPPMVEKNPKIALCAPAHRHPFQAQIAKRLESELEWIRNGRASVSKARAKNYEKAVAERKEGAAKLQQLSEG